MGFVFLAVLYAAGVACLWLIKRRAKEGILKEKRIGRLPARRQPSPPVAINPILMEVSVGLWVFFPLVAWGLCGAVLRLMTPPSARMYLAPSPSFPEILRTNGYWWLFLAGIAAFCFFAARLSAWITRWFDDTVASSAEDLIKAGAIDEAIRGLHEAIDADGPSVARWNALADALAKQERWAEVLKVSLDIEDRACLDLKNRRRKALALCKLGLPEVAVWELHRSDATPGRRLPEICRYCHALIDLGLFDRAWDQLRRAEVIYGRGAIPSPDGPHSRKLIDACRSRLAERFADEKPVGFDDL